MAVFAAVVQQAKSLLEIRECCLSAHPLIMTFNLPFTAASTDYLYRIAQLSLSHQATYR